MTVTTGIYKERWTGERIARLGFLLGLGWSARRIAADPDIHSTPNNVNRQAQRLGLAFRAAAAMSLRLPPDFANHFEAAASKRGLTPEAMMRRLLLEIAADPNLLDNILNDEARAQAPLGRDCPERTQE